MKQIKGQYGDIRTLKKDTKYKYILKLYNIITKKNILCYKYKRTITILL